MPVSQLAGHGPTLAYDDIGTGHPIVLLHAFPLDRTMWAPQLEVLPPTGFRVLAIDLPGFGESTAGKTSFTIEGVADIVADFLKALNIDSAVVGGLSMGGYIAMAFARRHPDQLRALILADTKPEPDDTAGRAGRDKAITAVQSAGVAAFFEGMLPRLLSEQSRQAPTLVERVRSIAGRQKVEAVVAALTALRDRPDATEGLNAVNVPTLAIVGELDAVTPPEVAAGMASRLRRCEMSRIPGAGHLSNLENPESFNQVVISFMRSLN
jgi:pimeloyl-ACP methyl ester carboxylesterase